MKTIISSLLFLSFLFMFSANSFSQNQNDVSKIIPGKKYKIVLFDDSEILGKVISIDSVNIVIQTESRVSMIIPKNNILYYSTNLTPAKYNFSIGLLGGISAFTGNNSYNGYSTKTKPGINFNLAGTFYLSDSKAIKLDAGYTYLKPNYDNYIYAYDPGYPSTYEGGDVSHFSFKGNIMVGSFNPSQRFIMYASLGFGIHYMQQKEHTYKYWIQNYSDTSWRQISEYHPSKSTFSAVISLGASLGYRFTDHLGVSGEIEYNMVTSEGFLIFGYGGYFPIRAGIFYMF